MTPPIYFLGDIHGRLDVIRAWNHTHEGCALIQVGDFGLGFQPRSKDIDNLVALHELLKAKDNHCYTIRGNHDDPSFFAGDYEYINALSQRTLCGIRTHLLRDNRILEIHGKRIFFCGGAVSVDRHRRTEGEDYWANEKFGWDGETPEGHLDAVVTHSAGSWTGMTYEDIAWYIAQEKKAGGDLVPDLDAERKLHDKLLDAVLWQNPGLRWFYGHFHQPLHRAVGDLEFTGLDVNQIVSWDESHSAPSSP